MKSRSSRLYTGLQFAYWAECACMFGFLVAFLQARGLNNTQIGISSAGGRLISLALTPFLSSVLDRRKIAFRKLVAIVLIIETVTAAAIALPIAPPLLMLSCIVCICCNALAGSLYTILGARMQTGSNQVNFAFSRAAGSAAFAFTSLIAGLLMEALSPQVVPVSGMILTVLQLILCWSIGAAAEPEEREPSGENGARPAGIFSARFVLLLCSITLLFAAHSLESTYLVNIITPLGGNYADLGRLNLYIALLEIPTMLVYSFMKKPDARKCLLISMIFYPAKALAVTFAPTLPLLYAAMTLQVLSFALFTPAVVGYVTQISEPDKADSMQFYASSAVVAGMVIAALFGGILLDALPLKTVLYIMSAISLTGACLGIAAIGKK